MTDQVSLNSFQIIKSINACELTPIGKKKRLQSIIIDFYTDFLLVNNRLYVTELDTKMDNIGILHSSDKIDFIVYKMDIFAV